MRYKKKATDYNNLSLSLFPNRLFSKQLIQSGRRKKGKTIVFWGVYELTRIGTNYMIFKICETEYKTIFSQAK